MFGYVHVEPPTGQLEFDFSEPAPPPKPRWRQPDLPFEEDLDAQNPFIMALPSDSIMYIKPVYPTDYSNGEYTITATSDPDGKIALTEGYKIAAKRPSIWRRFWLRFFLGFKWEDNKSQ